MTDWKPARKKPVKVEVAGPFSDKTTVETIEGDYEITNAYLDKYGSYYIIQGVDGERYPIAHDIFHDTYEWVEE